MVIVSRKGLGAGPEESVKVYTGGFYVTAVFHDGTQYTGTGEWDGASWYIFAPKGKLVFLTTNGYIIDVTGSSDYTNFGGSNAAIVPQGDINVSIGS